MKVDFLDLGITMSREAEKIEYKVHAKKEALSLCLTQCSSHSPTKNHCQEIKKANGTAQPHQLSTFFLWRYKASMLVNVNEIPKGKKYDMAERYNEIQT